LLQSAFIFQCVLINYFVGYVFDKQIPENGFQEN